ncbi:hypothetical protein BDV25DRAFT_157342 [Aspergillus avenaceus]|uniref:Uncharacterized protein n=1 Tax=Aspergillus avenaceus TaxID=36643 RepID=A0A5N6TRB8_ASPAV|nr:hypothetical protein BDV25DRAFT_157342 [Aspergillus avenaceus]
MGNTISRILKRSLLWTSAFLPNFPTSQPRLYFPGLILCIQSGFAVLYAELPQDLWKICMDPVSRRCNSYKNRGRSAEECRCLCECYSSEA